jgi:hypothetical protein
MVQLSFNCISNKNKTYTITYSVSAFLSTNNIVYCAGKLKALAIILLLKLRKESISMHTLIPLYFVNDPKYDQIEDFKFKK